MALALAINCGALLFARNATAAAQVVGLWRFNEGSGTNIYDSSGYGNNGYLVGENGNYPGWVAGQTNFGNCLYFTNDGSHHAYVEIPGSASLMIGPTATSPWSITAWAHETSDGSGNFVASYGRIFTGDAGQSFMFMSGAVGDAQMYTWHGDLPVWNIGWGSGNSVAPVFDTWVHWALVYDGTNLTMYRNGNQGPLGGISTQRVNAPLAWSGYTGEIQIGSETRISANRNWNGMLDDVAVFNGALTAAEVQKVMSGNFTNFIGGAPLCLTQPKSCMVRSGSDVTFSVVASGHLPLFYQWYFNTNTLLPQATNSTLVLTNVQANQVGSYSLVISNVLGTATSDFAFLTVTTNQPILVGLWRFDEGSGTNASDSSGYGNNGYLVGDNANKNKPAWVAGQTGFGSALYFTNNGSDHAYVNIPGSSALQIGATASNTWTITLWAYESSGGTGHPVTQYGRFLSQEGGLGLLPETGAYGDYQMYMWNGSVPAWDIGFGVSSPVAPLLDTWVHWAFVYDGYGLTLYRNGNQGSLGGMRTIPVTSALDFWGYTGSIQIGSDIYVSGTKNWNGMLDDVAVFRGALSQAEIAAVMAGDFSAYTNVPASIAAQPTNTAVIENHPFSLAVVAAGTPPYTYQWSHAGTNIPAAASATFSKMAVMADAGDYAVVVGGAAGSSVTSAVAVVSVLVDAFAPTITAQTASPVTLAVGETLSLSVTASGTSPLSYQWYFVTNHATNALSGATDSAYIKSVALANAGDYFAVVTNLYGDVQSANITACVDTNPPSTSYPRPRYEAEAATLNGPIVSASYAGYSGTGFIVFGNTIGQTVEWTVETPYAGTYNLAIRYANGSATNRPLALSVNSVTLATLAFGPSGGWTSWATLEQSVTLPAGTSTVRLTSATATGPNIDLLHVCYPFATAADLPSVPELPDPWLTPAGTRIIDRCDWPKQRHYFLEMLQHYIYGQIPPAPATITATPGTPSIYTTGAGTTATQRSVPISFTGPGGTFSFASRVYVPSSGSTNTKWPVVIMIAWTNYPADDAGYHQNFTISNLDKLLDRGYAVAAFICTSLAIDEGTGAGDRTLGLFPIYPADDFGAVAAWAFGASRVVDYLETQTWVDTNKIIVSGWSRLGKAALCAAIYDERLALANPDGSGCGGCGCFRVRGDDTGGNPDEPECIYEVTGAYPGWFSANFATFSGHEDRLPFDLHIARALVAPRALITTDGLDDTWANPYGTQMSFYGALDVFTWLGAGDRMALHFRPGPHGDTVVDVTALADFADQQFRFITPTQLLINPYNPNVPDAYTWRAPETIPADNLLILPGFESDRLTGWGDPGSGSWGAAATIANASLTTPAHTGTRSLEVAMNSACCQLVTNLTPNTTYLLSGYLCTEDATGEVQLGVTNHGNAGVSKAAQGVRYARRSLTFTTGPSNTTAEIYVYRTSAGTGRAWADDVWLVPVGSLTPRTAPQATTIMVGGSPRLQLNFNRERYDLCYTVDASNNLTTWSTLGVNPGELGVVAVTDTVDITQAPCRFLRLRISDP